MLTTSQKVHDYGLLLETRVKATVFNGDFGAPACADRMRAAVEAHAISAA